MAYCTNTLVQELLGASIIDYINDLTLAQITVYIAKVDGRIDDRLGGLFFHFNETTSTPDTPDTIKEISRHWSAAESLRQLVGVNNEAAMTLAAQHEALAMNMLDWILASPDTWMRPETKTGETLTFGTSTGIGWDLEVEQAFLANTSPLASADPPNILPSTVRITGGTRVGADFTDAQLLLMRNGTEFTVEYNPGWQKWVFRALDSRLYTMITNGTLAVAYEWNYRRVRGVGDMSSPTMPKLLVSQFA